MAEDKNKKEEEKAAVDSRVSLVESRISSHPDFPRRGVVFKDIFGIFADYEVSLVSDDNNDSSDGNSNRITLFNETTKKAGLPVLPHLTDDSSINL